MKPSPRDEFPRTTCACPACTAGCKSCPGPLAPGDAERIARDCGAKTVEAIQQFALDYFCASDGGSLMQIVNGVGIMRRIPTVVPRQKRDGSCVFLDSTGRCAVHSVSPFGCSHFDTHMPHTQADERSIAMQLACEESANYKLLWQMLHEHGRRASPVAERKAAMAQAVAEAEAALKVGN